MKLEQLFEREMMGKIPVVSSKGIPFPKGMADKSFIASGIQANVFMPPSLKNSNAIVKVAKVGGYGRDPRNDGYVKFVNEVLENPDNPFFPRIYSAKIYEDAVEDKYSYIVVVMEKLHPVKNENLKEAASALFEQIGITIEEIKKFRKKRGQDTEIRSDTTVVDLSFDVANLFRNPEFLDYMVQNSNNEYFQEAMNTARKFTNQHTALDLHTGNWMIRLTGHGPQLVMTDPLITFGG